jgi:hypothetical protein
MVRRSFWFSGVLAFCLASCATRVPIGSLGWLGDFQVDRGSVRAFEMNQNFPIPELPVSINGKLASLELDTGTPHGFMLTEGAPEDYGLEIADVVRELNADGSDRGFDAYSVIADEVSVLGNATSRVPGTVSSWKVFSNHPFGGTISPGMIGDKRVIIDYPNKYLAISDVEAPAGLPPERNCAARTLAIPDRFGSNVYVRGRFGNKDIVVYLDTGSSHSIIDPGVFEGSGLSVMKRGGMSWVASLKFTIGEREFEIKKATVQPILRGVEFDKPVGIALGADFLKDYILTIDSVGERKIVISEY